MSDKELSTQSKLNIATGKIRSLEQDKFNLKASLDRQADALAERGVAYAELYKELEETQEDLAAQIKENQELLDEIARLRGHIEAQKPAKDEALERHLASIQGRLQQAEALLMSLALATAGYHGQAK